MNVGDLKPMEFPMEFFLDLRLGPDALARGRAAGVHAPLGGAQFGAEHARTRSPTS